MPRSLRPLLLAMACALTALLPAALVPATAGAATAKKLTLVLPLSANTAGLEAYANDVSTPGNPLYHHYRSVAWLSAHFGAGAAREQKVVGYLKAHGASDIKVDKTGLFVDADMVSTQAKGLFGTSAIRRAARAGNDATVTSAASQIPSALKGAITGVVGLDTAPVLKPSSSSTSHLTRAQTSLTWQGASATADATSADGTVDEGSGYQPSTGTQSGCPGATAVGGGMSTSKH